MVSPDGVESLDVTAIVDRWVAVSGGDWKAGTLIDADGNPMEPGPIGAYVREITDYGLVQDPRAEFHAVITEQEGEERYVCFTGNGPSSAAHAHAFAHARRDVFVLLTELGRMRAALRHVDNVLRRPQPGDAPPRIDPKLKDELRGVVQRALP